MIPLSRRPGDDCLITDYSRGAIDSLVYMACIGSRDDCKEAKVMARFHGKDAYALFHRLMFDAGYQA